MAAVKLEEGTLSIDAAVIGRGLSVEPPSFKFGCAKEGSRFSASGEPLRHRFFHDFRFWHKADITAQLIHVRFWG
jgi:hypothetical protein